jgi:hypothetical protein
MKKSTWYDRKDKLEFVEALYMKQWYIAIAVAIVYLAISLTLHAWSWSWFIWVIYAVYRLWDNKKSKEN